LRMSRCLWFAIPYAPIPFISFSFEKLFTIGINELRGESQN
jgi:hypothetical protein